MHVCLLCSGFVPDDSGTATCVVLVGLHCSLACACGAAVGPFVLDCETESCVKVLPVVECLVVALVWLWFLWWYLMVVGVVVELCFVEVVFPVTLAFVVSMLVPSDSRYLYPLGVGFVLWYLVYQPFKFRLPYLGSLPVRLVAEAMVF
ncbi:hypothetical protein Taro_000017, partial [Colocasia esculenta]|nr:hypothetical protein [Colocasia esculenta]